MRTLYHIQRNRDVSVTSLNFTYFLFRSREYRRKNAQIIDNRELHNFENNLWDIAWCVLDSFFCLLLIDARIQNVNAKRTSNYARSQTKVSQKHIIVET